MIKREPAAHYRAGETFTCTRRPVVGIGAVVELGDPCGAEIRMHKFHWCAQICPVCVANYHIGFGTDSDLYLGTAGYSTPDWVRAVRDNIARNGSQYIPEFR